MLVAIGSFQEIILVFLRNSQIQKKSNIFTRIDLPFTCKMYIGKT